MQSKSLGERCTRFGRREKKDFPIGLAVRSSCASLSRVLYDCCSVRCIPLVDRLNRSPPVWECSLMTTPFWFLR